MSQGEIVVAVDQLIPPENVLKAYQQQADYMVKAGMLPPGYKSGADAVTVALRAREMGVPFWQAIQGMFPMKGRIGYMGGFLLSRVHSILPEAEILIQKSTAEVCELKWRRNRKDEYQVEKFDMDTAKKCNYHQSWDSEKKAWKPKATWNDTQNMLYWRCVTRTINRYFSDVFGSPVYTGDELTDIDADYTGPVTSKVEAPYATVGNTPPVDAEIVTHAEETKPVEAAAPAEEPPVSPADPPSDKSDLQKFAEEIKDVKDRAEINLIYDAFKTDHPKDQTLWSEAFVIKRKRTQELQGAKL